MKKIKSLVAAIAVLPGIALCQHEKKYIQAPTLGVHFLLNDYKTAAHIRATSLAATLQDGEFGKLKEMAPGLAVNYIDGLSPWFDFTAMLAGSFLDETTTTPSQPGGDGLFLEADVSIRGKLFSNKYWVSPFFTAGVGVSKAQVYWGAFMPVGVGIQLNLFDEAFLQINSQYRIPVTERTSSFHFFHSIGLAGIIGRKR